jgi:hypothetical protein
MLTDADGCSNAVCFTTDGSAAVVAMSNGCIYFFANKGFGITVVAEIKALNPFFLRH